MDNFVAIDFETANSFRSSNCSIGLVVVLDKVIVEKFYSLVKPIPNEYNKYCINVHGITEKDTEDAPIFPEVWSNVIPLIQDFPLVAHNMAFEKSCLKSVFERYDIEYPHYKFFDTLQAAKKAFPDACNHQLHTVSKLCGFELNNHHNALADAEACAHIAIKLF